MFCTAERRERTSRRRLASIPYIHRFPQRRSENDRMKQICSTKTKASSSIKLFHSLRRLATKPD